MSHILYSCELLIDTLDESLSQLSGTSSSSSYHTSHDHLEQGIYIVLRTNQSIKAAHEYTSYKTFQQIQLTKWTMAIQKNPHIVLCMVRPQLYHKDLYCAFAYTFEFIVHI